MKIGDKVRKPKGYSFDGTIRSVFENSKGETRIVAELDGNGMLHIFSPSQLELREEPFVYASHNEAGQWKLIEYAYKQRQEEHDRFITWVDKNYTKGTGGLYRSVVFPDVAASIDELWMIYNKELNK
jgi:hypothetical protein